MLVSGVAVAYNQPDDYTHLQVSNYYAGDETSPVINLKWSPDFRVLCVLYDSGVFSLFSVFGSLLYTSKDTM